MDRLTTPLQAKADGAAGTFEGFAATFNDLPDAFGDVIMPFAFSESLLEHESRGSKPALLWSHDQAQPIGKWLSLREDEQGLKVRGKLTMALEQARNAYELLLDGALSLSIGFRALKQKATESGNLIEKASLLEVSLVAMPANPAAKITAIKSLDGIKTVREFETLMRECHGLSARQAKKLSQDGFAGLIGDTPEQQAAELASLIRKSAARFHTRN